MPVSSFSRSRPSPPPTTHAQPRATRGPQAIVFVLNFADELFEDVFERNQAHQFAAGVAHQSDMGVLRG